MLAHTEACRVSAGISSLKSSLKSRMTFFLSFKLEIFCYDISKLHDVDPSQKTDLGGNLLSKPFFRLCLFLCFFWTLIYSHPLRNS